MASDAPKSLSVWSPGRINLIGEHTDYNDGWVLPMAIDRGNTIKARQRPDMLLAATARRFGDETDRVDLAGLRESWPEGWRAYVRGVAQAVLDTGVKLRGADLEIDGDLPLSGGLSSSSSLTVGVALALMALVGHQPAKTDLALMAQQAERKYVGVNCGIMDQLAIAAGQAGHALLIDCRSLAIEPVPLPANCTVIVIDSGVPRTLADSAYNQRRAECERAVEAIRTIAPEVMALRDVSPELLGRAIEQGLLDQTVARRARHVVHENERTLAAVAAMRRGDVAEMGRLMNQSHVSLRDDYEVSGPELDTLTAMLREMPGVWGARLTGAGFGGCCIALADSAHVAELVRTIGPRYDAATGRTSLVFSTQAAPGAHVVD
jgi:galactokinase